MKHPLLLWLVISAVYAVIAVFLGMTLRDEMVMLLWLYLMIGIPILISCLLLVVLFFKTNRKVFWTVFGLLVLTGAGIVGYDLLTVPR